MRLGHLLATAGLLLALLVAVPAASGAAAVAEVAEADEPAQPTVVERVVIGHSVRGRPIRAFRLGEPGKRTVLLVATMHGDEGKPRLILQRLRDGRPVRGIDLWVVPTYNPDGLARGTRKNARGVDLNRNFPFRWADLDGSYESGPRPGSEPETRAMMRFLRRIQPDRILSFHQPLFGVDTDTKDRAFARRVARHLDLPRKSFDCGGICHGTMTGWFNNRFAGSALTVEYGWRPSVRRMTHAAPRQVLRLFGARWARR